MRKGKAQMWFTDFVIGTLIFLIMLIAYYSYIGNISKQDTLYAEDLAADAESVSTSILLAGFPDDWVNSTVQSIGITNNNQRVNETKLSNLNGINYLKAKKLLGTVYDFFIYFEDENGNIVNLGSECGYGSPSISVSMNFNNATYYNGEDNELEEEINEIESEFGITIPKDWDNINDFMDNINDYEVAVIETPKFNPVQITTIESYVSDGNIAFIGKHATNGDSGNILNVLYVKRPSCSAGGGGGDWGTVTSNDIFLDLNLGTSFQPNECNYVSGTVSEFAEFNDSTAAIAKWSYGSGTVYYFSDFNVGTYNLQSKVKDAIKGRIIDCGTSSNISINAEYKNFVRMKRFVILNLKPAKMVMYMWQ